MGYLLCNNHWQCLNAQDFFCSFWLWKSVVSKSWLLMLKLNRKSSFTKTTRSNKLPTLLGLSSGTGGVTTKQSTMRETSKGSGPWLLEKSGWPATLTVPRVGVEGSVLSECVRAFGNSFKNACFILSSSTFSADFSGNLDAKLSGQTGPAAVLLIKQRPSTAKEAGGRGLTFGGASLDPSQCLNTAVSISLATLRCFKSSRNMP